MTSKIPPSAGPITDKAFSRGASAVVSLSGRAASGGALAPLFALENDETHKAHAQEQRAVI
jgi:hypothetical protein